MTNDAKTNSAEQYVGECAGLLIMRVRDDASMGWWYHAAGPTAFDARGCLFAGDEGGEMGAARAVVQLVDTVMRLGARGVV